MNMSLRQLEEDALAAHDERCGASRNCQHRGAHADEYLRHLILPAVPDEVFIDGLDGARPVTMREALVQRFQQVADGWDEPIGGGEAAELADAALALIGHLPGVEVPA